MATLSASEIAGRRIRDTRERRGLTARELAARCAAAGAPHVTATVITNLETSRRPTRKVGLDELLVLAVALEVPPLELMIPMDAAEELEVVPGTSLAGPEAVHWIAGEPFLTRLQLVIGLHPEDTADLVRWMDGDPIITTMRQVYFASWYIRAEDEAIDTDPGREEYARELLPLLADRLMHFAARLEALGYDPPGLVPVREILRKRGLPSTLEEWRARERREPGRGGSLWPGSRTCGLPR
jgi:transcriptional regulator with XRE-family HTH domain